MPEAEMEPSQLAINKLLSRIEADESIPIPVKEVLSRTIPTRDRTQIDAVRASIAEWVKEDESQKHPTK